MKDFCTWTKLGRKLVEKGKGGICKEARVMLELAWGFRNRGEEMEGESTDYHRSY